MSRARDPFLDGLRAVSVVRVVLLHLLQRVHHPLVASFSFFMPGMPLMFFVSGALAATSLERTDPAARMRFWRGRARRLFLPFWAFGAVVLSVCAVGAIAWPDAEHAFPFDSLWRWVLPLAGPQASPAYERLNWHLWFLSSLVFMLASAPWTVALHRRFPGALALLLFGAGAAVEFAALPAPDVVRNTLLFGSAFQLGYAYADGSLQRLPRWIPLAAAGGLAMFALLYWAERAPGQMLHAARLALVSLGLAFVALWVWARPFATRIFEHARPAGWIRAINARAYTIFLWGPVANDIAGRVIEPASAAGYLASFALALALLAGFVRVFGPVEDWAARRTRKAPAPPAARPTAAEPPRRAAA